MAIRVLVVDDQAPFRRAARRIVSYAEGFEIVGEAESGEEAVDVARRLKPDLVLMDLRLGGIDGLEATRGVLQASVGTVVLIVSACGPEEMAAHTDRLAESGAAAYVPKSEFGPERLEDEWAAAAAGAG